MQVVALGQQDGPQDVKDGLPFPAGEGTVDAAVVAELFRQMVPLAACPHPKDDAVEGAARVATLTAPLGRRVIDGQDFLDQLPERVRNIPDRRQRLGLVRLRLTLLGSGFNKFSGGQHTRIIGSSQAHL